MCIGRTSITSISSYGLIIIGGLAGCGRLIGIEDTNSCVDGQDCFTGEPGNGTADAGGVCAEDLSAPTIMVDFPFPASWTTAQRITIRGRISDDAGDDGNDDGPIVRVNERVVTSSLGIDGYRHWSTSIELPPGGNMIQVQAEDSCMNSAETTLSIMAGAVADIEPNVVTPRGLLFDDTGHILVTDTGQMKLVRIDSTTMATEVIADSSNAWALAIDDTNGTLFIMRDSGDRGEVLRVDGNTGERATLSGQGVGSGVDIYAPVDMILLPEEKTEYRPIALYTDEYLDNVIQVMLDTGTRSQLGRCEPFGSLRGIALDPYANGIEFLIADILSKTITRMDRDNNCELVSGEGVGDGVEFSKPQDVVFESPYSALVTDSDLNALLRVDLTTGNREILSGPDNPGPNMVYPFDIALDRERDIAVITDSDLPALIAIDATNGERVILTQQALIQPTFTMVEN